MKVILFRQILSVTTSKMNSKAIINRTITPKIASDCRTVFDLFLRSRVFRCDQDVSVGPSVGPSVDSSVGHAGVKIMENRLFPLFNCKSRYITRNNGSHAFRQVLSVIRASESKSKVIIAKTITPKIASDCQTLFDLFLGSLDCKVASVPGFAK